MLNGRSDVLVIGAGPAGAAAAVVAARGGARVALVDKARFPREKVCGDAISNSALDLVEQLAGPGAVRTVPSALVAASVAVFPDGSRVRRDYGTRPGAIIERTDFDHLIRRSAEAAGATVHEGVTVRTLIREGGRWCGAEGPGFRWEAPVTIVASGSASLAADALGLSAPKPSAIGISATGYLTGVREGPDADASEHYFDREVPSGYGWIFPAVEGRSNVGVYLRVDRYHARKVKIRELFDSFLARHEDRLGPARRDGKMRSWSLPLATFRLPPAAPGMLACGDAARLIDPLTGEGIWHALASGMRAGEAAVVALGGGEAARDIHRSYARSVALHVAWPTALRRGIEDGVEVIVRRRLYEMSPVRRLLEWGFNRSSLEISKTASV